MNSSATLRHIGDVAIIDVSGRISLSDGLGAMRTAIREAVNTGHKKILLNLAEVSYIDSAGLGEMASAYITVTNMGGKMKLLHAREKVHSMLHVTKLYMILVTYSDEADALASFA